MKCCGVSRARTAPAMVQRLAMLCRGSWHGLARLRLRQRSVPPFTVAVLVVCAGVASPALAAEGWVPAAGMQTDRGGHVAALLDSGDVLVAGGATGTFAHGYDSLSSAELYDPTTNSWSYTGSLNTPRVWAAGTVLEDGTVLVAGGREANFDQQGPNVFALASAERYDPSTGTWSAAGSMSTARSGAMAVGLKDGRVLVIGGDDAGSTILRSAELYDPSSGTWSTTGSMIDDHAALWSYGAGGFTATLLQNGEVLVAGGGTASAELYDPGSGTWRATGSMNDTRSAATATLLPSGKVLVAGGDAAGDAELYDPSTGVWTATGSMAYPRSGHTATLLRSGKVLVLGGFDMGYQGMDTSPAELYDPVTGAWTATGFPSWGHAYPRFAFTTTLLPSGVAFAAGGLEQGGNSNLTSGETMLWPAPDPSLTSTPSAQSNSPTASFGFSADNADLPGTSLTFACSLDGAPYQSCTSPAQYSGLQDGSHSFAVRATNGAGLTGPTPAAYSWTVDTVPGGGSERIRLVGLPKSTGRGVVLRLHCSARAGQHCQTDNTLATVETLRGGQPIAVSAAHKPKKRTRTLIVGRKRVTIAAGSTKTITIALNAHGRKLLKRFHALPVTVAVRLNRNGKKTVAIQRKLTIKQKKNASGAVVRDSVWADSRPPLVRRESAIS